MELADARGHPSVDLAEHDGAATGVLDHPGLEVVGSKVDEAAHRAGVADDGLDHELVQPVLRRDDVPVSAQVRRKRACRVGGVLCLHREDDVLELADEVIRHEGRRPGDELGERTFDAQSRSVDRNDVVRNAVYERDVVSRAREVRTDGPADRAGAPYQELHGISLRVSRRDRRRSG